MSKFICLFIAVFIGGCASSPTYEVLNEWDKSKLAKVYIYRTDVSFHSLNPEKPFFYFDGKSVGKLGTGQFLTFEALEGTHDVTVKEPILFMPTYEKLKYSVVLDSAKFSG